jgi:xylulokinase
MATSETPLVIAIDVSTTACKAIAWAPNGQPVAEGRAAYALLRPAPDWYEQRAQDWWEGVCTALRDLLRHISSQRVKAICVTHQRESFVPVDDTGHPLRNAILWLDERSRAQTARLARTVGEERFHRLTGKPLTPNPSITKILWLQEHEPDIVTGASKLLDTHAFLVHKLTGAFRTSLASADPMGLVDLARGTWAPDLLDEVGLRWNQVAELASPGSLIGEVDAAAAAATGLPEGLPVVAGAGDGQCAGLGANALGTRASLNMGTAITADLISPTYVTDRAFRTLGAPIAGEFCLETVIQGGVFTVSWFVEHMAPDLHQTWLPLEAEELLEAAAAKVPPGALGLMLVPYWHHAMTPYWDAAARGITVGWTGAHGREHLYRAILEGLAFEQRLLMEGVQKATKGRLSTYVALGGGSRSDLWCQILADVIGLPIVRAGTSEATCLGAAILAAAAIDWQPDVASTATAMTTTAERFEPDPERQGTYHKLYEEVYRHLYPALRSAIHRLTELTDEAA